MDLFESPAITDKKQSMIQTLTHIVLKCHLCILFLIIADSDIIAALESRNFDKVAKNFLQKERKKI